MKKIFISVLILFFQLKTFAAVNVTINPLVLLVGPLNLGADFQISDSWTLGPSASYSNSKAEDYYVKSSSLGITGRYFFNHSALSQGGYLATSLSYLSVEVTSRDVTDELTGKANGLGYAALVGYMWLFKTNFNISLGAGAVGYSFKKITVENEDGTQKEDYDEGLTGIGLGAEFIFGWKF